MLSFTLLSFVIIVGKQPETMWKMNNDGCVALKLYKKQVRFLSWAFAGPKYKLSRVKRRKEIRTYWLVGLRVHAAWKDFSTCVWGVIIQISKLFFIEMW